MIADTPNLGTARPSHSAQPLGRCEENETAPSRKAGPRRKDSLARTALFALRPGDFRPCVKSSWLSSDFFLHSWGEGCYSHILLSKIWRIYWNDSSCEGACSLGETKLEGAITGTARESLADSEEAETYLNQHAHVHRGAVAHRRLKPPRANGFDGLLVQAEA